MGTAGRSGAASAGRGHGCWRPALAACLVGAILLTAGCSSVLDGGETRTTYGVPERTTAETHEPGSTVTGRGPTATSRSSPREGDSHAGNGSRPPDVGAERDYHERIEVDELAPGLTPEAVTNPATLADAHRAVLENRSFRVVYRRVERPAVDGNGNGNATPRTVVVRAAVSADRRRYRVRRTVARPADGPRSRVVTAYWSGEAAGAYRMIALGRTRTFGRLGADELPGRGAGTRVPGLGDPTRWAGVERAFAATVVAAVRDVPGAVAPARYRINATGGRVGALAPGAAAVRNVSLRAVVDSRGLVAELRLSYEVRSEEGWTAVSTALSYADVGRTTPSPPEWVGDARRATAGNVTGNATAPADPGTGRSDGRTVERSNGRTVGRSDGRAVERSDGRTAGRRITPP